MHVRTRGRDKSRRWAAVDHTRLPLMAEDALESVMPVVLQRVPNREVCEQILEYIGDVPYPDVEEPDEFTLKITEQIQWIHKVNITPSQDPGAIKNWSLCPRANLLPVRLRLRGPGRRFPNPILGKAGNGAKPKCCPRSNTRLYNRMWRSYQAK